MSSGNEPSLEEVLAEIFESKLVDVHTALPGRVESYDAAKQTANVKPMVKHAGIDKHGKPASRSFPVLPNVPIAFPRGGGFFCTFPLQKGDFVLLVFCESSIDQWRAKGIETYPGDLRRHGISSAIAYPGLYPTKGAITSDVSENMVMGSDGGAQIHVKESEICVGSEDGEDFAARADRTDAAIAALQSATSDAISAITPTGGGPAAVTAFNAGVASIGSSACDKVKLD